jgi:hypothetical protein
MVPQNMMSSYKNQVSPLQQNRNLVAPQTISGNNFIVFPESTTMDAKVSTNHLAVHDISQSLIQKQNVLNLVNSNNNIFTSSPIIGPLHLQARHIIYRPILENNFIERFRSANNLVYIRPDGDTLVIKPSVPLNTPQRAVPFRSDLLARQVPIIDKLLPPSANIMNRAHPQLNGFRDQNIINHHVPQVSPFDRKEPGIQSIPHINSSGLVVVLPQPASSIPEMEKVLNNGRETKLLNDLSWSTFNVRNVFEILNANKLKTVFGVLI